MVKLIKKPRNRFALDPIMRKGGAHVKEKCVARRATKHLVDNGIDEWLDAQDDFSPHHHAPEHKSSGADDFISIL